MHFLVISGCIIFYLHFSAKNNDFFFLVTKWSFGFRGAHKGDSFYHPTPSGASLFRSKQISKRKTYFDCFAVKL